MKIREVMTPDPRACGVNDSANDAAHVMWEHDCGVVPVVDSSGNVSGVVTDRDLCMAAHFRGQPLSEIRLADIMTPQPATCAVDDDLTDAERLMQERQVRRLPVVDRNGGLVGIVSLADLTRAVKSNGAMHAGQEAFSELVQTVAAVSAPRN
jgi:CBS domain-containing protein